MTPSKIAGSVCFVLAGFLAASIAAAQPATSRKTTTRQESYGTQDYTVTRVPGVAFYPGRSNQGYYTSGSQGRFGDTNVEMDWYASLDLPPGAVVDYVGFNNYNDGTAGVLTFNLEERDVYDNLTVQGSVTNTAHNTWKTDRNASPIGYLWGSEESVPILQIHQLSSPNMQFIGYVEVWWRRTVGYPEFTTTFNDVPIDSPYYLYVEALVSAGITAGCGGDNYCPSNPVTRGQMAVFLAKALGLHWGTPAP